MTSGLRRPALARGGDGFVKGTLVAAAMLASQSLMAQQPPTGGSLQVPAAPVLPRTAPEIRIEQRAAPVAPSSDAARVVVRALRLQGHALYTEAELLALTRFTPGAELTLADLEAMAGRITAHYRDNGYFVAQAYLPAQDIRDGVVTIAVSEGRLGNVRLRNETNLSDHVAHSALAGLSSGDAIATRPFENRLLLLSDVPGVNVRSTLVPGTTPGTSDLMVDVLPGERVTGSIDADNGGNRYTGAYRVGATLNVNNPLGLGDVASLRLLTSGSGLRYGRGSYQLQVGRGQVGVAYSRLAYELGKEFTSLGAHGTADIASVFGRYPVLRSRNDNVYLQLAAEARRFEDHLDSVPSVTDRNARVLMASAFGDHRDGFGGGGVNSWFVTWSHGVLDIETPAARTADALAARTNGSYDKLSFSLMRLQRVGGPFSLYAGVSGQVASKNLDVSEKMSLGGMNGVRAYPEGEAYADQGVLLTVEARMDLPPPPEAIPGRVQLIAFADAGSVETNHTPWAPGDNRRTLGGAGLGLNWAEPGNFLVRAFVARRVGSEPATSAPDRSARFWVQAVKYF